MSQTRATAAINVLPEVAGYSLAKFSRSKSEASYISWLGKLNAEKSKKFFDDNYHGFGHASIADLAHVPLAIENIPIVHAIQWLDDQLLDCQERSTRYMDFNLASFYTPPEFRYRPDLKQRYEEHCQRLFSLYQDTYAKVFVYLLKKHEHRRAEFSEDKDMYEKTLAARAFDVARYLLPMSTLTGIGIYASGRTYERLISKLLSHPLEGVREDAALAKKALTQEPAFNLVAENIKECIEEIGLSSYVEERLLEAANAEAIALPTLVKYAEPSQFVIESRQAIRAICQRQELSKLRVELHKTPAYARLQPCNILDETIATLLFSEAPGFTFKETLQAVRKLGPAKFDIYEEIEELRAKHDPVHEGFACGYTLLFDIVMDVGAFRDLHRHRNWRQFIQPLTPWLGYDVPAEISDAQCADSYNAACTESASLAQDIIDNLGNDGVEIAQYCLPLAFRTPWHVKTDLRQFRYVTELRTKSSGHFSYRNIAWQMHEAVKKEYPWALTKSRAVPFENFDPFVR